MGPTLLGVPRKTLRWSSTGQMFKKRFLNGKRRKENGKTGGNGKQKQERELEQEQGAERERGREQETVSTGATPGTTTS
jgi:hypothetical protein